MNKTLSFINGELYNYKGNKIIDADGNGILPPIGSIIGIYPDANIISMIDTTYWKVCDGNNGTPNLTGDVFLMGGINDNLEDTGGNNDGHYHNLNIATGNYRYSNPTQPNVTNQTSLETHVHSKSDNNLSTRSDISDGGTAVLKGNFTITASGNPVSITHRHPFTVTAISGQTNTGLFNGDLLNSNKPKYFKTLYYMRIG